MALLAKRGPAPGTAPGDAVGVSEVTEHEKREKVIEGLREAIALLEAQQPATIEERLVLDKLNDIRVYAQVNEVGWMDEAAAFAETVMRLLREEINRARQTTEQREATPWPTQPQPPSPR